MTLNLKKRISFGTKLPLTLINDVLEVTSRPPSFFAPYPAPLGFEWQFVTVDGERVTLDGKPVVELVEI